MKKFYLLLGVMAASLQALPMDPMGKGSHAKLNDPEVERFHREVDPSDSDPVYVGEKVEDPSMYDPVYVDEEWLTAARRRAHEGVPSDQSASSTEKRAPENTPILESAIPADAETPVASSEKGKEEEAPSQKEDRKTIAAKKAIALAEALFEKGEEANRFGKIAMRKTLSSATLEQEEAAYASAERAWAETVIAHEEAITKAKRAALPSCTIEELQEILQEAEANRARWNAHGLHVAARKEGQNPLRSSSPIMTRLLSAWDKAVEAYHISTTKAKAAALDEEAEELAAHHQMAMATKASFVQQAAAEAVAKKRVAAETEARRVAEESRRAVEAAQRAQQQAQQKAEQEVQALVAFVGRTKQLTATTENLFAQAKASDTSAIWTQAAAQARSTSQAWNQLLGQLSTQPQFVAGKALATAELTSTARFQQERWKQKALLASIRAEAKKKEVKDYNWNDVVHLLNFARQKTQPSLEQALDRVLGGDRSKAAIAAVCNTAHTSASASAHASAYAYTSAYISAYDSAYHSAYESEARRHYNEGWQDDDDFDPTDYMARHSASDSTSSSASASQYASTCASVYALASVYASANPYTCASACTSAHICDSTCWYVSASAYAYSSASPYASASEASESFKSAFELRNTLHTLQQGLLWKNYDTDSDRDKKNLLEGAIALTDKIIHFAAIMKEVKTEEERLTPPPYRGLEESGLRAFETAYQARTKDAEGAWNQAQAAATQIVTRWNQEIQKKQLGTSSLPCSLEEMQDQRERWQQKALVAELHALEESAAFKKNNRSDRLEAVNRFVSGKSWYLMKASMEAFIAAPQETMGTHTANPICAEDQAEQLELQANDCQRRIQQYYSPDRLDYIRDVTSTTARFLRAVAAFKRTESSKTKG